METRIWQIWHRTFEGDECWTTARCPDDWESYHVETAFRDTLNGGVGGDPAEFISCEWYEGDDDDWGYDLTNDML